MQSEVSDGAVDELELLDGLLHIAETALEPRGFRPLSATLDQICHYVRQSLDCYEVRIRIRDGDDLVPAGYSGDARDNFAERLPLGNTGARSSVKGRKDPSVEAFITGQPRFVTHDDFDPSSNAFRRTSEIGINSLYYTPITWAGGVVGVLACYWSERLRVTTAQARLVGLMCRLASVSMATAVIADDGSRARATLEAVREQLEADNSALKTLYIAQSRMIGLLTDGSTTTAEQVAQILASVLDRSVLICDPDGQQLALEAAPSAVEILRAAKPSEAGRTGDTARNYTSICVEGAGQGRCLGHVFVAPPIDPNNQFDQVVARQAALVMSSNLQATKADTAVTSLALPAMLLGHAHGLLNRTQVKELSALLGVHSDMELTVCLIRTPTPEAAVRLARRPGILIGLGWSVLSSVADGRDVLVLLRGTPIPPRSAMQLKAAHPEIERIAFGSTVAGMEQVPAELLDAQFALRLATEAVPVTYHADFGAFVEVTRSMSVDQMRALVDGVLGAIQAYDRERRGELVKTVRVYVENEGRVNETAAALSVHVNTLTKRLDKIAALTGKDVRLFRDISRITLALDLLPTVEGLDQRVEGGHR